MLSNSECVDCEMHGPPIADIARIYADLTKRAAELGIEPIGYTVKVEQTTDDDTAYDRGALCEELDGMLGDLIERTMHRYMPRKAAQALRRNKIKELADSVIGYDQTHGKSA